MAGEEKLEIVVTAATHGALAAFKKTSLAAGAMGGAVVAAAMIGLKAIQAFTTGVVNLGIKMGKLAVESATDFQTAVLKVRTMLDITGDEVGILNELLEEQAKAWGIPAMKQAAAAYLIASGLTKDLSKAQIALVAANKLAVVGFDDLRSSTAAMITVMRATGADLSKVDEITQKLWATVRAGILETSDLEGAMGKLAGTFKFVPFEEVLAAFAVLTTKLGSTEIAATSLNRLIMAFTMNESKGARAAKKLGIEFGITALQEKGFMNILKELNKVFETDIQAWKSTVPEMRAFRAAAGLVGDGLKDMEDNLGSFDQKMRLFERLIPEVMATTRKEVDKTREEWEDAWRDMGEEILPSITDVLKTDIMPLLKDFGSWIKENREEISQFFRDLATFAKEFALALKEIKPLLGPLARVGMAVPGAVRRAGGVGAVGAVALGLALPPLAPAAAIYLGANYFSTKDPQERMLGEREFTEEVTAR